MNNDCLKYRWFQETRVTAWKLRSELTEVPHKPNDFWCKEFVDAIGMCTFLVAVMDMCSNSRCYCYSRWKCLLIRLNPSYSAICINVSAISSLLWCKAYRVCTYFLFHAVHNASIRFHAFIVRASIRLTFEYRMVSCEPDKLACMVLIKTNRYSEYEDWGMKITMSKGSRLRFRRQTRKWGRRTIMLIMNANQMNFMRWNANDGL